MSNIDPGIIDPGKGGPPPRDIVPEIDPDDTDDLTEPDDIKEPGTGGPAIEPDPEERRKDLPNIHEA
ncbi:hypothetical protein [Jiella sp. M17.18]|uniref:hypothetical protein n=1 Tax=Jiella sp. M17.18 TaxID=3234247 RepID=UPI0034DED2D6